MTNAKPQSMTNFFPTPYHHWKLELDGPVARLHMDVNPQKTFRDGYELKLNSYDLGVDLELNDIVEKMRFEHPEVKVVVIDSANPRIFSAGANIFMLQKSPHPFKVNFCKFTNETRCSIEEATAHSGQTYIAAVNGICAGGGFELALACQEIYLVDDGNSTVALPEIPLLGVLPGTGGLTRLVDKRRVRRDLADVFATVEEGLKGKKAKAFGLIDDFFPKSKFAEEVGKRVEALVKASSKKSEKGIVLKPLTPKNSDTSWQYDHVRVHLDRPKRLAEVVLHAPKTANLPDQPAGAMELGCAFWPLQVARELDHVLCRLRLDEEEIGLVVMKSQGEPKHIAAYETFLAQHQHHWFVKETILKMARTLRRLDLTAKSFYAVGDAGSAFHGFFLEVALACDRIYLLNDEDQPVTLGIGPLSSGLLPMPNGLTRLQSRFQNQPEVAQRLAQEAKVFSAAQADEVGLCTVAADGIDWEDEIRLAIEGRLALSPDALTGMESSLRFAGGETCDSKIFGRLSAWQNWIFIRPNAVGESGALTAYGKTEGPKFDWRRT